MAFSKFRKRLKRYSHRFAGRRLKRKYGSMYQEFASDRELRGYHRRRKGFLGGVISAPILLIGGAVWYFFIRKK